MERRRRVYPAERHNSGWLSFFLLSASAIVLLSGWFLQDKGDGLTISPLNTRAPIPLNENFDETPAEREMTLPSASWYALQLGAFESETAASELARQYMQRGAAGFVWHDGRYRTLAAVYPLKEDAQNVRRQLQENHAVESYLYQIDLPSIHIRLTGMEGQLEILEAAFLHANDLVAELQSLSTAMDRQEISREETLKKLLSLKEQMDLVALRLQQRFASPRHETVTQMVEFLAGYETFCSELSEQDSAVTLGTKLKHQTLASLFQLKQVYDTLHHT